MKVREALLGIQHGTAPGPARLDARGRLTRPGDRGGGFARSRSAGRGGWRTPRDPDERNPP